MISYYSATKIIPLDGPVLEKGVIATNAEGEILGLYTAEEAKNFQDVQYFEGLIVPGFINVHCHLELAHMQGKIPCHTGLVGFIQGIIALRNEQQPADIEAAIRQADQSMYEKGIVAVGDISNGLDTRATKLASAIAYHTFIEVLGFNQVAGPVLEKGLALKQQFEPLPSTIVAHAPYSVNAELMQLINAHALENQPISIHNQETQAETELFTKGTGKFVDFFQQMGIALRPEHGQGKNSLAYHLPFTHPQARLLLVHNTFSLAEDIDYALAQGLQLYWGICANANLYIENRLPDINLMRSKGLKLCLGTDSLASNWDLDILAEMKTIHKAYPLPFEEILTWACKNGAEFLGLDKQLGSISPGKKPGLVWIKNVQATVTDSSTYLQEDSQAIRLV